MPNLRDAISMETIELMAEHLCFSVWEGFDPYQYFRSTPDARVFLGGENESVEETYMDQTTRERKMKALIEKLADLTG